MNDETATPAPPARAPIAQYGAWLKRVVDEPYRFDFYQALRRIESAHPHLPRLGEAARPADEPIRVGQPAELTFEPSAIHSVHFPAIGPPRLMQRIFGLLGTNGALPIHITELAHERSLQHADPVLQRFMDTLTHRFALLFYRAWAQAQPVLSLDRPGDTQHARRLGALAGLGNETLLGRDAVGDHAKLHFIGRLARQARDADGLLSWCKSEFDVPVNIEQWRGHWMSLGQEERTRLRGSEGLGLGRGAVLGTTVWDVQHKFRVVVGPVSMARFVDFLPDGPDLAKLQAMVRQWVGLEFQWDVKLILLRTDVPAMHLGTVPAGSRRTQLGRTSWLGLYRRGVDAEDLVIDVERTLRRRMPRHPSPSPAASAPAHPTTGLTSLHPAPT